MEKLHESCWNVLKQMENVESPWGYQFSFSKDKAWNPANRFMIMTLNPSAVDYFSQEKPKPQKEIRAKTPWTDESRCDFFAHNYPLSPYIQGIFYELARLDGRAGKTAEDRQKIAEAYAENNCPIAPFVPFRTQASKHITKEMYDFAESIAWPSIFGAWLPELIIVTGMEPYKRLCKMFPERLDLPLESEVEKKISDLEPGKDTPNLYRFSRFGKNGKSVGVLYIPHPTAARYCKGLPGKPETGKDTPFRRFLASVMADK